jgi:hypothetical protein
MRTAGRLSAIFVGACVLIWSAGCYTGQDYATENGLMLSPGMSMAEVESRIGEPTLIVKGDPGSDTEWIYRYSGGPSTAATVFMVVFFVVLIVAIVLSKNKSGSGGVFFGVGGGGGPPYQIRLHFDREGRLLEVSRPYPVEYAP